MHLAIRPTPCTTGQVHLLVYLYTVRGKILEGENFGESLLTNQMARKILANQLAGLQLFHCIYNYWRGKIWRFVHHSPNSPKFSPSKFFPRTVYKAEKLSVCLSVRIFLAVWISAVAAWIDVRLARRDSPVFWHHEVYF